MLPEAFRMFARHHQDDDGCTKKNIILRHTKNPNLTLHWTQISILGGATRISKYISNKLSQCSGGQTRVSQNGNLFQVSDDPQPFMTWWFQPGFYGFRFHQIGSKLIIYNKVTRVKKVKKKWKFPPP